jgi:cytochrome P450 family 6
LSKNPEVLRMHPASPVLDRICSKSVRFPEQQIQIEEGTSVMIPIYGLHYDPQYFPDPEKFDPERFSEENKSKIKPFTYLPFGEGPRNCIGENNH